MTGAVTVFDPAKPLQRLVPAIALCVLCAVVAHSPAWAGFVTTNEVDLDKIFSQSAFGTTPIDVRFNPTVTIGRPDLLSIDSEQQLDTVFQLGGNNPLTIDIFFVDAINECGGDLSPQIIGCGEEPGNKIVVESGFAASSFGAALMGHELGHNLGLDHVAAPPANLMNPTLNGSFALRADPALDQVGAILSSPLVQIDHDQRFILITPFAIVPEPATMLFALAGGVWVLQRARRRAKPERCNTGRSKAKS